VFLKKCRRTTTIHQALKIRCKFDIQLFARYFFPHYCRLPFSRMHQYILRRYQRTLTADADDILQRKGYNEAIAAPRGYAKSTLKTLILPIHSILYQQEKYIIIISATLKQATQRLRNIKAEFLNNKLLQSVYADELKQRSVWTTKSINVNGVQVDVFSAGTELRGITYGEVRPTRIIIDDGEDSEAVENPEQREKLLNWFNEVIENLGDSYTRLEVIGTVLHPESLLETLLKRPDFKSLRYSAVIKFAENQQLWDEWHRLLTDLRDPNRLESARQFFEQQKNEMLKGAQVLWKQKEDYYQLMCQLITRGRRAFFKEKQNEPRSAEYRIFDPESFVYFALRNGNLIIKGKKHQPQPRSSMKEVSIDELKIYGFLDSALGGGSGRYRKSDYAAIATVGVDRYGYCYLLDMWLQRATPTQQVRRIFELHERWNYHLFGIEANCFQSLLLLPIEEERKRLKSEGRTHWQLAVQPVTHKQNKIARITALEPLVTNGWLLFNERLPRGMLQQCQDFPDSPHDDALDALEGAVALARHSAITPKSQIHSPRRSLPALNNF